MSVIKEKTSSSSSSSSNIPPEIIEIILSKVSSKSLLRFKAVSKSWNTMISDPVFVQNHLQSSNPPNNLFLNVLNDTKKGFSLVQFEGRKFQTKSVLETIHSDCNVILCECNGVLLLSDKWLGCSKYVLWNPSTRRETCFEFPHGLLYDPSIHGICYDHVTDDFKVVAIAQNSYGVYSCKNNSWTIKEGIGRYRGFCGIFVDGATYWVLMTDIIIDSTVQIVYFDPKTDELKKLQKPEKLADNDNVEIFMVCLRGSLFLYCSNKDDEKNVQFWIKEKGIVVGENPWKEFNVVEAKIRSFQTPCLVENKLFVGYEHNYTMVVNYSPSEKKMVIEEFDDSNIKNEKFFDIYSSIFAPYRNSLYFPAGVKTEACCGSKESGNEVDPSSS